MLKTLLIIILVCIKIFNLYNYSISKKEYDYIDYLISFNDLFKINEKEYRVIFYLEGCPNCLLTFEIISKRKLYDSNKIFYVNIMEVDEKNRTKTINNIGVKAYEDVYVNVAPLLLSIEDRVVVNQIDGEEKIINYLEKERIGNSDNRKCI